MSVGSTVSGTRQAAVVGVVLFWVGALVAGALALGYSARTDYIWLS